MNKITTWISLVAVLLVLAGCSTPAPAPSYQPSGTVGAAGIPVEVVRGGRVASAVLDDSPAGRAFAGSLPVTVEVDDRFGLALVGALPAGPEVSGQTLSTRFVLGEIAYSPEAEAIAVFHDDHTSGVASPGVVRLGVVTEGLDGVAAASGRVTIRPAG
ncbi:MAG: cyclophilin-like fold protein [Propionicimonas sp.]|uniref:cyclophilin-like fold protein n=1 Tax=Propionicimonas sp. TaxID=1955623 RepID=UPI003D1081D3